MRFGKLLKIIGFCIAIIPFGGAACHRQNTSHYNPSPKYILNGAQSTSDGDFVYYLLEGGASYAVALTESAKTSNTGTIEIDSTYSGKPVTGIWRNGFADSVCTKVKIPNSITVIDYEAFIGSKITTLNVPASVSQIGEAAFYSCKYLTKVLFANSTSSSSEASSACSCVGEEPEEDDGQGQGRQYSTLTKIPSFCFFTCTELQELVLPQSIQEIEYEAFNGCKKLFSTITFMNIKTIRSRAFQNCTALTKVYLSSSFFERGANNEPIGIMEEHAFNYCNSGLTFYMIGSTTDVNAWRGLSRNLRWNWKDDRSNPDGSGNRYAYEIISSGGASYTNDWIYTTDANNDVTITSYIGPTQVENHPVKFITFPDELPSGSGHKVRKIERTVFESAFKANLERVYLPKYLKRIEYRMFNTEYSNLTVVDVNTTCTSDETYLDEHDDDLTPRIDLHALTDLEIIDSYAFVYMTKLKEITKLYLPYSLKVVGTRVFGGSDGNDVKFLKMCTDFKWYYNDELSALKIIGREAFFKLGKDDNSNSLTSLENNSVYDNYIKSDGTSRYTLSTLIIPRTFEHFGLTTTDVSTYSLDSTGAETNKAYTGAFAGCPLLSKVIFKGNVKSEVENNTANDDVQNLAVGTQTFVYNESLRTVVVEERVQRKIIFHTTNTYSPAIGWNSGKTKNDFTGDPTLQTLVLPNYRTDLYVQDFAFQGNSRGAVYLSGAPDSKFYKTTQGTYATSVSNPASNASAQNANSYWLWRAIGDEARRANTYYGYCFANSVSASEVVNKNSFGLEQKMPLYTNVHYKETIAEDYAATSVEVGVGNTNEYKFYDGGNDGKFSFICDSSNNATLTNFLYDRYSNTFTGTAKVPAKVQNFAGTDCTVNKVGDSAFSAAFCDSNNYSNVPAAFKDLTKVSLPSTIATIGEYAFMRAYGLNEINSYDATSGATLGEYVMPSSLTSVGRHAFAFCNVVKFLKIPVGCKFYENTTNTANNSVTSVFSNNFSLRRITFGDNLDESTYYKATTYTHSGSSEKYTSALYSKNVSGINYCKPGLLLVLNRDESDYLSTSSDLKVILGTPNTNEFDAWYSGSNANKYLYGAYKMGYWIDSLKVGNSAKNTLNQPLISGIYDYSNKADKYVYLNDPIYNFVNNTPNLKTIVFDSLGIVPPYAFEGCSSIDTIRLPRDPDGTTVIPSGIFAYLNNANVQFEVPTDNTGEHYEKRASGVLDLRYTNYAGIAADAFKESSINTIIAPERADFTIETNAFANCNSLTSVDFSHVTGTVVLNGSFAGSKINNNLFTWSNTAEVEFGDACFAGCKFPGNTFTFPEKTTKIGKYCFEYCNIKDGNNDYRLKNVTAAGNLTLVTEIDDCAFINCLGLNNFDFEKFTNLERIGAYALSMKSYATSRTAVTPDSSSEAESNNNNGTLTPTGVVSLPASVTTLGTGAFHSAKITQMIINSSTITFEYRTISNGTKYYSDGGQQFRFCKYMTSLYFTDLDCDFIWEGPASGKGQQNFFSDDTRLTELFLPTGFDLFNTYGDSTVYRNNGANNNVTVVYTAHTFAENTSAPSNKWRKMSGSDTSPTVCDVVYYAATAADLTTGSAGSYAIIDSTRQFWTRTGTGYATVVKLGKPTSIDAQSGLVTFDSGHTLARDGTLT